MVVDLPSAETDVDRMFHALADATRRDIVAVTTHVEQSVSALAERYPMSFAAVQKHVAVLERAGIVVKRKRGREQLVRTDPEAIGRVHAALDGIEMLWRDRLGRFEHALADAEHPTISNPAHEHDQGAST